MNNVKNVKTGSTAILHSRSLVPDLVNFYVVDDLPRVCGTNIS